MTAPVCLTADDDFVLCPACGGLTEPIAAHNYCTFCGYVIPCCEPDQRSANPDPIPGQIKNRKENGDAH